jgi:PAS domain S-box-containing protein
MKFSKAFKYTLLYAASGFVATALVFYVQQNLFKSDRANHGLAGLGDNTKTKITRAHLWFEELLGGDQSINFEQQVLMPIKAAQELLQKAYDGKVDDNSEEARISDEDTRALLKESIIGIEKLSTISQQLWAENKSATGSELAGDLDKQFDIAFAEAETTLEKLSAHLQKNANNASNKLTSLSWISILAIFGVFCFSSVLLFRIQRSNERQVTENETKLDAESKRVQRLSNFIEAVSAGDYDIELLNTESSDNLTDMLVKMRNTLKQNAEEDRRRNWATTGQAQIGEILRANTSNSSELYDNIIKFLVKYTKSNQGGLFILNDDNEADRHLELMSCYAFERKKFLTKKIAIGDGLVGQCYLEGEKMLLLEVPQEYVSITSGLGGTNPNALLIVPMKVNDKIYGVIELASFKKYEPFEIELVEKLAESIASTISNVRVNETTRILLEKTQQQAEEMKSQEEEIRQNMEELEATQEEMRRKQTILEKELDQSQKQAEILRGQEKKLKESQDTLQAIIDNIPRAIFWKDRDLKFMGCNNIFAAIAGAFSPLDLIGKSDFDMAWSAQAEAYRSDDMEVMKSRAAKLDIEEVNINSQGEESWVRTSKVPIINATGDVVAILGMFEDITALKKREADLAIKLREREQVLAELEALKQLIAIKKV